MTASSDALGSKNAFLALEQQMYSAGLQRGERISLQALQKLLRDVGAGFSESQVRQIVSAASARTDGTIEISELFSWMLGDTQPNLAVPLAPPPPPQPIAGLEELKALLDERDATLRAQLSQVSMELTALKRHAQSCPLHFTVGQYNILAGYMGNNTEPWFLYGPDVSEEKREKVLKLYGTKDDKNTYIYDKWPLYVEGLLTLEEQQLVEKNNREHFNWDARKDRLLETIKELNVDILSLVECDHYEDHFKGGLEKLGYESRWKQRPRSSSSDGCCIAWRPEMFECIADHSTAFVDRYCNRRKCEIKDRMALMVLLRFRLTGEIICFVSTHLARNPEQEQLDRLRARQVAQMMRSVAEFTKLHRADDVPVVLVGDMNATCFRRLKGIANAITLLGEDGQVHPFIFDCADVPTGATSVTTARNVRIDAILYQKSRLQLVDVGVTPPLTTSHPIPNDAHPSDHIPVSATLCLRSRLQMAYIGVKEWYFRLLGRGSQLLNTFQLHESFKIFDHDGAGCVTAVKLYSALSFVMGFGAIQDQEVAHVASQLPSEGLDFESFCRMYCDAIAREGLPCQTDLKAAFKVFDKDGTDTLCLQELIDAFSECAPTTVPGEEVEALFARVDRSGRGRINLDEFLAHLSAAWGERFLNSFNYDRQIVTPLPRGVSE